MLQGVAGPGDGVAPVDEVVDGPFGVPEEIGPGFFAAAVFHGQGRPVDDGAHHAFHESVDCVESFGPVQVYFQNVGEDVGAAVGGLGGGNGAGVLRGEEGNFRPEGFRGPAQFFVGVGVGDDGAAVHFRARGGHGGNGHEGEGAGNLCPGFHQVPGVSFVEGASCNDLGGVNDAAAAYGQDEVDARFPAEPGAPGGQGNFRVRFHAGNFIGRNTGFLDFFHHGIVDAVFLDGTAAVDQKGVLPPVGQFFVEMGEGVIPEVYFGGIVVNKWIDHGNLLVMMIALLYSMGGMEGMLVGLPPAVGVLARIPGRKGVERFLRWTGLSPRGFLGCAPVRRV